MKKKILYAKFVEPKERSYGNQYHHDVFVDQMMTDKIIRVEKHKTRLGWYVASPVIGCPFNYHHSWLKFVPKPKGNK